MIGSSRGTPGLGLLDPEGERFQVDPLPGECEHLLAAHAGVEPEPESVPDRRAVHLRLDSGAPARQHLCRGRDLAPLLAVELAAAGEPEIDRIAQPVQVDAGPAVDRAQKRHRAVGRRPAVVGCDAVEAGFDILARDGVDRAGEPIAQVALAAAVLVRGRDRDGEGQTHRVARGRLAWRRGAHDQPGDRTLAQAAR